MWHQFTVKRPTLDRVRFVRLVSIEGDKVFSFDPSISKPYILFETTGYCTCDVDLAPDGFAEFVSHFVTNFREHRNCWYLPDRLVTSEGLGSPMSPDDLAKLKTVAGSDQVSLLERYWSS